MAQKPSFNAVIEGSYQDEWRKLNYKITSVDVPLELTVLNDGVYRYPLYGKTTDFQRLEKFCGKHSGLEHALKFLGFCQGIVLPYEEWPFSQVLDRPRAVVLRDGRVFVDDGVVQDRRYVQSLPSTVETARNLFNNINYDELYRRVLELRARSSPVKTQTI